MCTTCDYEKVLEQIDELLEDDAAAFAEDTLEGIKDWVTENSHVTEKQRSAVENIAAAVERKHERD